MGDPVAEALERARLHAERHSDEDGVVHVARELFAADLAVIEAVAPLVGQEWDESDGGYDEATVHVPASLIVALRQHAKAWATAVLGSEEAICKCGGPGEPTHPCPYSEEIGSRVRECNCCDACRRE